MNFIIIYREINYSFLQRGKLFRFVILQHSKVRGEENININNDNNNSYTCSRSHLLSSFQLCFAHGLIFVQLNLQHSQAQPYSICTCINPLYLHHTEKLLVPFFKSLAWLCPGWIRTKDLSISKQILVQKYKLVFFFF